MYIACTCMLHYGLVLPRDDYTHASSYSRVLPWECCLTLTPVMLKLTCILDDQLRVLICYLKTEDLRHDPEDWPSATSQRTWGLRTSIETLRTDLQGHRTDNDLAEWVRFGCPILVQHDRNILLTGQELSGKHMGFAQTMLRSQFQMFNNLQSTLFQSRSQGFKSSMNAIQIMHSCSNHWILATTLQCDPGEVRIHDSVYELLNTETLEVVKRLFGSENEPPTVSMITGAPRLGI